MKKDLLIGTGAVLLILAGVLYYGVLRPTPVKPAVTAEDIPLSGGSSTEHATYYDILTNYPSSTPLRTRISTEADTAALALMQTFVNDTVTEFKTEGKFDRLTPEDIRMLGFDKGRKETLQITYLIASSPRTVSYIYTVYEDTLGAHGNTFFRTFTFDMTTGASLTLHDLFVPGADYLGTLSSIARAKLPTIIGEQANQSMLEGGTTPEKKNFTAYFIDNQDLAILFAPYAVAPYSAGPQTLRIPVRDLKNILRPEYR